MTPAQLQLLFMFINMGIDTIVRLTFLVDKIIAMTPEELDSHIASEEMRSNLLMDQLNAI